MTEKTVRLGRNSFLWLNGVGGLLVLASYAWGVASDTGVASGLWGGVPEAIRPLYTVNMLLSAAGYFLFAPYVAFRLDAARNDYPGKGPYSIFHVLMFLVLIPSAIWLPATAWMIRDPNPWLWLFIRVDLALVAIGSLGLLIAFVRLRPPYVAGRGLAILGTLPFCLQTVVLDALVWPAYFGT